MEHAQYYTVCTQESFPIALDFFVNHSSIFFTFQKGLFTKEEGRTFASRIFAMSSEKLSISPVRNILYYEHITQVKPNSTNFEMLLNYDVIGIIFNEPPFLKALSHFLQTKSYQVFTKEGCLLAVRERKKLQYENRESQQCVKVQRIQLENEGNDVEQICLRVTYPTDQVVSFLLTNFPEDFSDWETIYELNIKQFLKKKTRTNFFEPVLFGRFPDSRFPRCWQQVDVHMLPTTRDEFIDFLSLECRLIQINHVNCWDCNYLFVDNEFCNCNDVTDGRRVGEGGDSVELEFTIWCSVFENIWGSFCICLCLFLGYERDEMIDGGASGVKVCYDLTYEALSGDGDGEWCDFDGCLCGWVNTNWVVWKPLIRFWLRLVLLYMCWRIKFVSFEWN